MFNRRNILAAGLAVLVAVPFASISSAAGFSWDGTWSGKLPNGKKSIFTISNGKVVSWYWVGFRQNIRSASVTPSKVTILHVAGAKAVLQPLKDGTVLYTWSSGRDSLEQILTRN